MKMELSFKKLEAGRFASFYGFGKQPEEEAISKLFDWCFKNKIDLDDETNQVFGFNNPNPTKGTGEYGYEIWIKVNINIKPQEDMRVIEFNGGTYAAADCIGAEKIYETWQELYKTCVDKKIKVGYHQPLEKIIRNISNTEKIAIELYLPVIEEK